MLFYHRIIQLWALPEYANNIPYTWLFMSCLLIISQHKALPKFLLESVIVWNKLCFPILVINTKNLGTIQVDFIFSELIRRITYRKDGVDKNINAFQFDFLQYECILCKIYDRYIIISPFYQGYQAKTEARLCPLS